MPIWNQHYWSSEMIVRTKKEEFSGLVTVHCSIAPRQSVWAMFTLFYATISILTLFGCMYGFVQFQTAGVSWFLWTFPLGFVLWKTAFIPFKIGQKKGKDQMLH